MVDVLMRGTMCTCKKATCVDEACTVNGVRHHVGETYMIDSCQSKCFCHSLTEAPKCEPVCTAVAPVTCPQDLVKVVVFDTHQFGHDMCSCRRETCVKKTDACLKNGVQY